MSSDSVLICKLTTKDCIRVGLRWSPDRGVPPIDLDAACVAFDTNGHCVDAAYYNNLYAISSVIHSGDCKESKSAKGDDESISVHFDTIPSHVVSLMVSIHAYDQGALSQCATMSVVLMDLKTKAVLDKHPADFSKPSVTSMLLYVMQRDMTNPMDPRWVITQHSHPLPGRNFMDGMPQMLRLINVRGGTVVPSFNMHKGDDFQIPGNVRKLRIGLGWDTRCDLDASAILLQRSGAVLDLVYFGNKQSKCHGVVHAGDNLTGEGDGDDETIFIDLDLLHPEIFCLIFTVNVFTSGRSFSDVEGEFCRLVDERNFELCRYNTLDNGDSNAVLFCAIFRDDSKPGWWRMQAIGQWGSGRTAKDLVGIAQDIMYRFPGSTALPPRNPLPTFQTRPSMKNEKKECCLLM